MRSLQGQWQQPLRGMLQYLHRQSSRSQERRQQLQTETSPLTQVRMPPQQVRSLPQRRGSVSVVAQSDVALTGISASALLESVTVNAGSVATVTGIGLVTNTGTVLVWSDIITTQSPNYSDVNTSQTAGYSDINTNQTPSWTDIAA
jgi:hypothetical protein